MHRHRQNNRTVAQMPQYILISFDVVRFDILERHKISLFSYFILIDTVDLESFLADCPTLKMEVNCGLCRVDPLHFRLVARNVRTNFEVAKIYYKF